MQIREAVGAEGLYEPPLFAPVLSTFVFALPVAYRDVDAPTGSAVQVEVTGDSGGAWSLRRAADGWRLSAGSTPGPAATVRLDQETAWKLWTKGLTPGEARSNVAIEGDRALGEAILRAVAIIA
jgi:hypothetical protein